MNKFRKLQLETQLLNSLEQKHFKQFYNMPIEARKMLSEGFNLCEKFRYRQSIICFDNLLTIFPDNGCALFGKGSCLYKMKRYFESLEYIEQADQCYPNNIYIMTVKTKCLIQLKMYEQAIISADAVLTIQPKNQEQLYIKGKCLQTQLKYEGAANIYYQIINQGSQNIAKKLQFLVFKDIGICLEKTSKHKESLKYYNEALKFQPNDMQILHRIGILLYSQQKYSEAMSQSYSILKKEPNNEKGLALKGFCLFRLNQFEQSQINLNKALEQNPENFGAKLRLQFINQIAFHKFLHKMKQYHEAIMSFDSFLRLNPPKPQSAYELKCHCLINLNFKREAFQLARMQPLTVNSQTLFCKNQIILKVKCRNDLKNL